VIGVRHPDLQIKEGEEDEKEEEEGKWRR